MATPSVENPESGGYEYMKWLRVLTSKNGLAGCCKWPQAIGSNFAWIEANSSYETSNLESCATS
jgi:hypothetical protein